MAVASVPDQPQYGGYEYKFVDKVPERLICSTICTKVLSDPHLTACCGQHFCESCLQYWFRTQGREGCPHCRSEGMKFVHIPNKALKREIDDLNIHCTNHKVGCKWEGKLSRLNTHLESEKGCGYVQVNCTNKCKEHLKRKDLANHLTEHCPLRKYKCQHCGEEDTYQTITEKHYNKCPNYPLDCPNECGVRGIKRAQHRSTCPLELIKCSNRCKKRLPRKDLADHLPHHCPLRKYKCQYCGEEDTYQTIIEKHYDECPNYPLDCPNKCGTGGIKRAEMGQHQSKCPLEPVECPFKEAGCQAALVRREFDSHITTNQQQHLLTLRGAFRETKAELDVVKTQLGAATASPTVVKTEFGTAKELLCVVGKEWFTAKAELSAVKAELGAAKQLLCVVGKEFLTAKAELGVVKAELGAAKELLCVVGKEFLTAKAELSVVKKEFGTAKELLCVVGKEWFTAKAELSAVKAELGAAKELLCMVGKEFLTAKLHSLK